MSSETIRIPRYYLPCGPVVLDGDIYYLFNFPNIASFRKTLKELEKKEAGQNFFRINNFEKYYIKNQNKNAPYLKTSSHTFVFTENFFLRIFPQFHESKEPKSKACVSYYRGIIAPYSIQGCLKNP